MPSLHSDNLMLVYPHDANDMYTCSSCHALHDDCLDLHDRINIAMFISVAKCYVAVLLLSSLRDAS